MTLRFGWVALAASVGLVVLSSQIAAAQVTGSVQDPTGQPITVALVELWGPAGRIAGGGTAQNGRFSFSVDVARSATILTVRRIGFAPQRLSVAPPTALHVVMFPFAVELPAVIASAGQQCPIRDERAARELWSAIADRFAAFHPGQAMWSDARVATGIVQSDGLGAVDTLALGPGHMAAGRAYYAQQTERIRRQGYATPVNGLRLPRFDAWDYPYLESLLAGHFLDPVFADKHHFALVRDESGTSIAFCASDDEPSIDGFIRLDADQSPTSATWRFRTTQPDERAGGEVIFGTRDGTDLPALVPLIGLFWRKRVFDFYQEWWEFHEWHSCITDPGAVQCQP